MKKNSKKEHPVKILDLKKCLITNLQAVKIKGGVHTSCTPNCDSIGFQGRD